MLTSIPCVLDTSQQLGFASSEIGLSWGSNALVCMDTVLARNQVAGLHNSACEPGLITALITVLPMDS